MAQISSWQKQRTDAEEKFKEINEAYEVLSNDQKKTAYDQFGHAAFDQIPALQVVVLILNKTVLSILLTPNLAETLWCWFWFWRI